MDPYFSAKLKEYEASHNNDGIHVDGWILFSDGARREVNPLGVWGDVPASELERCKRIEWYFAMKTQYAVEDFEKARDFYFQQATFALKQAYVPDASKTAEAAKQELAELQATVRACQKEWKAAQARLEAVERTAPELEFKRKAELRSLRNRDAHNQLLKEITTIKI